MLDCTRLGMNTRAIFIITMGRAAAMRRLFLIHTFYRHAATLSAYISAYIIDISRGRARRLLPARGVSSRRERFPPFVPTDDMPPMKFSAPGMATAVSTDASRPLSRA